jgi:UDP-glucose 4-epimerase
MPASSRLNVLVTGGAGYIGSHAVLALLAAGHRVTVIDDLSTGFRAAVPADARFCAGDIADRALVRRLVDEDDIHAIMHFAGSVVVPESIADPLKYYRNNTVNAQGLIECAVAAGVRHFVFSSSAAVYGTPDVVPVAEDAATRPINPSGASKLMTEVMLRDVAAAHPLNHCALRYFNVAGADPDGRAGQSTAAATHLIKVAVEAALGKRSEVVVFGNDREIPVITVARYVRDLVPGSRIVHVDPAPQDPTNRCPDLTLTRKLLPGWTCHVPYEVGVKRTLDWFAARWPAATKVA